MQTYDTLDTLSQFSGIGTGGIGEQVGDVVDGGGWVLEALEIDACLGVGKGSGRGLKGLRGLRGSKGLRGLRGLRTSLHPSLEDLVFDALQRACLDERTGVEGDAIALVDLHSQLDGRDGSQTGVSQWGGNIEVAVVHDASKHFVQFLFEHVHGEVRGV